MTKFYKFIESVKIGDIESAKLNYNSEFFTKDNYGLMPIHWACITYQLEILKWILENKCDVNLPSKKGWRPIHFAVFIGNRKIVELLIDNYCDLECKTNKGKTVLDIANGHCGRSYLETILRINSRLRIALSMDLKCSSDCDHKFCLNSMMKCKFSGGEIIGRTANTRTLKFNDSMSNRKFAVMEIRNYYNRNTDVKFILKEINRYLRKIDHQNIIKYYGAIIKSKRWKIFMEWNDIVGLMDDMIKLTGSLSDEEIARYCKDILQAVAFLHHNKIIHRDINPSNIFIKYNGGCKLILSIHSSIVAIDGNNEELIISYDRVNYLAPEVFSGEQCSYPADIWSVGATVIHMLTGFPPYYESLYMTMVFKIAIDKKLEFILTRPISEAMQKLIDDMTKQIPSQRGNANNLLNYEFLRNSLIDTNDTNENNDQSINGISSPDKCIDLIQNALSNKKIGQVMGLMCNNKCDHKFCLSSVIATNFKFGEFIGNGGFGFVYKMKDLEHNRDFVMKTVFIDRSDENEIKCFESDINNYQEKILHPNIVKYFGVLRNSMQIFIFMEFIDGGTLRNRIAENQYKPLPEKTIKLYTKQILKGVKFLHASKIIHRDIKSENILVTKEEIIKIADFGLSSFLRTISNYQKGTPLCGTPNYMAPEVITGDEKYDHFADIWSVGATVLEMASGRPPCYGRHLFNTLFKIGNEKKLEYPENISNEMKTFLDLMIQGDPVKRKDAKTLLKCDFLTVNI